MPRRPGDREPDPPGGRAAERQRAFLEGRFPAGQDPSSGASLGTPPRGDEGKASEKDEASEEDEASEKDEEGLPDENVDPRNGGDPDPDQ
jgi:hypothetical protein